jgi:hypothetical protein
MKYTNSPDQLFKTLVADNRTTVLGSDGHYYTTSVRTYVNNSIAFDLWLEQHIAVRD